MKSINLAVVVSLVGLMASALANAEVTYKNNGYNQNFSKRPYAQPLPDTADQRAEGFEGATLVREVSEDGSATDQKQHVQRLNNLSKRPY